LRGKRGEFAVRFSPPKNMPTFQNYFGLSGFAWVPSSWLLSRRRMGEIHHPKNLRYRKVDALLRAKVRRHAGSQNLPSVRGKDRDCRYRRHQPESLDCAIAATGATLFE
jgi:hypothetical protein